jgi:hypothetical protein
MKMEQTECSEMSAYKTQTLGNYPEESVQHSEHGESLKSRTYTMMMIIKLTDDVNSLQFWNIKLTKMWEP